ncbi:MAG: ribosomal-processing cysteine protease Prp [Bacilli bacterium]
MIRIFVEYSKESVSSIKIKGHGSGEKGYDIVCAGVSSCFVGGLNNLKQISSFDISIVSGDSYCNIIDTVSDHDSIVLETMIVMFETIADSYPKDVKIEVSRKEG